MAGYTLDWPTPYHCNANCLECSWFSEDPRRAHKLAKSHVLRTGHTVQIETGRRVGRTTVEEILGVTPEPTQEGGKG